MDGNSDIESSEKGVLGRIHQAEIDAHKAQADNPEDPNSPLEQPYLTTDERRKIAEEASLSAYEKHKKKMREQYGSSLPSQKLPALNRVYAGAVTTHPPLSASQEETPKRRPPVPTTERNRQKSRKFEQPTPVDRLIRQARYVPEKVLIADQPNPVEVPIQPPPPLPPDTKKDADRKAAKQRQRVVEVRRTIAPLRRERAG